MTHEEAFNELYDYINVKAREAHAIEDDDMLLKFIISDIKERAEFCKTLIN